MSPRSPVPRISALAAAAMAIGSSLSAPALCASDADIGVRSKVMDKELQWSHKSGSLEEGGHGKTFAILAIDEVKAAERLVKPVDKENILRQLIEQLLANGFKGYTKGTKPDIVLAVSYGRGEMSNPYFHNQGEIGGFAAPNMPGFNGMTPPNSTSDRTTVTLTGAISIGETVFDHKTPGYEAKLQKAAFEKLFIRVTAFEYPKEPNTKPKMLWKTIIVADDPDHRDLNAIAAEMLKVGAPYFDRDLKKPEIEFRNGVPQGQVNVGTPQVVQTDVKK